MIKTALLFFSLLLISALAAKADNGDVSISLDPLNTDTASDLRYDGVDPLYSGKTLTPAQAYLLETTSYFDRKKERGSPILANEVDEPAIDLSTLSPPTLAEDPTSTFWNGSATTADSAPGGLDASLPIENNDEVQYSGTVNSSAERFRFNIVTAPIRTPNSQPITLTLMASRTLHTFLLRKEILRKLGYQLPAMKYISQVKVRFSNVFTRDEFLTVQFSHGVDGSADHWCKMSPAVLAKDLADNKKQTIPCEPTTADDGVDLGNDPNLILLQDVAAMDATPLYYNLALGPPIQQIPNTENLREEGPRELRALAIAFALVNMDESLNLTDWFAARVQNRNVIVNPNDIANFGCTYDDAVWILRKIASLTRDDFAQLATAAHFPGLIAQVVTEKLIARRNSLFTAFNLSAPTLTPDPKITLGNYVQNGKVLQQNWPGYASRFAYGDPESPLKGLGWYALSQVQSNVMAALIEKANQEIPSLSLATAAQKHEQTLMAQAYESYLKTGEIQPVRFGVWVAPILNGQVNISRDTVFGNYLGTNNLVQLADSFGLSTTVGITANVDALPTFLGVNGLVTANLNFTLTHLKPILSFKAGITEPLDEEFVPWLFFNTAKIFEAVAAAKNSPATTTSTQLKQDLVDSLNKISKHLGIGESFILSETLTGTEQVSVAVQAPIPVTPTGTVTGGENQILLSRLQIYRKDATTITVYKDRGELNGYSVAFELDVGAPITFPVLNFTAKTVAGDARSKSFSIDITADPAANPDIYKSANALVQALHTGSTEILESIQKPTIIVEKFKDKSTAFHFFHYQHRRLKTNAKIEVIQPNGTIGNYLVLNDGKQHGANYQALATEAATYVVQRITNNNQYGVDTQAPENPGQSLIGHSQTRNVEFQSRFDHGVSEPYVRIQSRYEGWSINAADVQKIADEWSAQYGFQVYPTGFLADTQKFLLYNMNINLHFYTAAIQKLTSMTPAEEKTFEDQYEKINHCDSSTIDSDNSDTLPQEAPTDTTHCSRINDFHHAFKVYRRNLLNPEKQASAVMNMISALDQFANFPELVQILGGQQNVYVTSQVNGFRIHSEATTEIPVPIQSNTYGTSDPVNPTGVVDSIENTILGIGDGEFYMQWLRDVL